MSLIVDSVGKVEDIAFETFELISLLLSLCRRRDGPCEFSPSPSLGSSAARLLVLSTPSDCPLRDIFMRSCETRNTSIWVGLPNFSLLHFISPSHELLAMAASLDLPLTTRILSFIYRARLKAGPQVA